MHPRQNFLPWMHFLYFKFRFIELLIFEFVRRGDLWSPAKCFDFVGNLVIILQFRHCRFTTMTGRPQVAPTVLYDKQLDKSEFDRILDDKKQSCDEVLPGEVPRRTVLIRGEGIRNHRFSIGSTSVPPRVASLVTFLSTQESNAPRRGADDRHAQHGA